VIDPRLPGLETATDDGAMRAILSRALGPERPPLRAVRHSVLKHAPGKHSVIEYRIEREGEGSERVIGKLYREPRAALRFGQLQRVHDHAAHGGRPDALGVPEPLAHVAELGMVLLRAVPGTELSRLDADADWIGAVRAVADNLAHFHCLPVPADTRSMADHVRRFCRPSASELVAMRPHLANSVENVLRALALVDGAGAGAASLVHGDLGLGQVLLSGSRAYFVDLDGLCRSHPALDVANFLISLRLRLGPLSAEPERAFVARYRECRPREALAELDAYQALAYLRRAAAAFRPPASPEAEARGERLLAIANWIARAAMEAELARGGSPGGAP